MFKICYSLFVAYMFKMTAAELREIKHELNRCHSMIDNLHASIHWTKITAT